MAATCFAPASRRSGPWPRHASRRALPVGAAHGRDARTSRLPRGCQPPRRFDSRTNRKHHINTPQGVVAIETRGPSPKIEYLHRDHLGSLVAITDAGGGVTQRLSFDAFGARRGEAWEDKTTQIFVTNWGYTGHQQQDDFGLIHMNGRVYDPGLARFISADPFVQAPGNTQSFNRYSYVINNPLAHTDPSGFFSLKDAFVAAMTMNFQGAMLRVQDRQVKNSKTWRAVYGVAAVAMAGPAGLAYGMAAGGAYSTYSTRRIGASWSEALKAGAISAGTAAAFYGVGSFGQSLAAAGVSAGTVAVVKVVLHGMVGGLSSTASGGKFREGFYSAAFTQALAPVIQGSSSSPEVRVIVAAVVGGTASELGGGKFANGAVTGAFAYAFGNLAQRGGDDGGGDPRMVADASDDAGSTVDVMVDAPLEGVYPEGLLPVGRLFSWAGRGIAWVGRSLGFGGKVASEALTVSFGHGARHLAGTGLSQGVVETAIGTQVQAVGRAAGGYWGRVSVQGTTIEYRAYPLANGGTHVGTYYPVRP
jgi:RHS repeat-associated protein